MFEWATTSEPWDPTPPCVGHTQLFYPTLDTRNPKNYRVHIRQAALLCDACPHQRRCLSESFTLEGDAGLKWDGIRAGLGPEARHELYERSRRVGRDRVLDWALSFPAGYREQNLGVGVKFYKPRYERSAGGQTHDVARKARAVGRRDGNEG